MRRFLAALLLACFAPGGGLAFLRGADAPGEADRVVALPPFMVEEAGRGPPWRYAAMPGFEILARCGDSSTRTVIQAYHKLHHLLDVVLPESLRVNFSEPRRVILYSESLAPAASQDVIARRLRGDERHTAPPIEDAPAFGGRGGFRALPASRPRVSFMPNLRLSDADATYVFTIVREENLQVESLYLTPDYVNFLLRHRTPALPAWFMAAFLTAYRDMTFRDGTITLKPLVWISEAHTDAVKKDPKTAPAPGPLAEFFRGDRLRLQPGDAGARDAWTAQGALLVRWALDPAEPARREAFWKFVARASRGGVTEAAFIECFGFDLAAAQAQLAAFLPIAVRRAQHFELPRAYRAPDVRLRDATPVEIACIKGDWERLEVGYVKEHHPEFVAKYLEQARRTLLRAYEGNERDPRLLTALGLYALDAGEAELARDYLEAAARGGPLRARAWLELARLRHAAALARPGGEDGRLNSTQTAEVLTPLFATRTLNPPLAAACELIADTWARCDVPATRGHLAVLDEGVALFPRQTELVYRTATLYHARGWTAEARGYIELGLQIAGDTPARVRFVELQASLPAAAP